MTEVFLKILNMSLSAGWLVLAVLLLRCVFRKAPKWIRCAMWALVGLRLVLPVSLRSVLSLQPTAEAVPMNIEMEQTPLLTSGIPPLDTVVNGSVMTSLRPDGVSSVNPMQILTAAAATAWLIGVAVMAVCALVSWLGVRATVREAVPFRDDGKTGVMLCDRLPSSFILGVIRPKIYIPSGTKEEDIESILAHENAHLRRRDHLWKPLGYALLSVYWFHPLMWAAYVLLCRDIELACDEKVIAELDSEGVKSYCSALINCGDRNRKRVAVSACPLAFGESNIKSRVKNVLGYKKVLWVAAAAAVCAVIAAVCFMTDPAGVRISELEDIGGSCERIFTDTVTAARLELGEASAELAEAGQAGKLLDGLALVRVSPSRLSKDRSEDRESARRITLLYEGSPVPLCINLSLDGTQLWLDDGVKSSYTYKVVNPAQVKALFEKYLPTAQPTEIRQTLRPSYASLDESYTVEQAADDGCVVIHNSDVSAGQDAMAAFLKDAGAGKDAAVRIAYYYTLLDPSHFDPDYYEEIKDDYPQLFFSDLYYSGGVYTLLTKDDDGNVIQNSYRYLLKLEGELPPTANYRHYTRYVLSDDPSLTWEDIEKAMFSSILVELPRHAEVYCDVD